MDEIPDNDKHGAADGNNATGNNGDIAGAENPAGAATGSGTDAWQEPPDDTDWRRVYWFTGLLGVAYVIILGIFTLLFNTPAG